MASSREEPPLSKKRVALRQISKDDDPESEEEEDGAAVGGTFRRASDQVLAERRIVKVRRTPAPSSAPNPFAAIQLVPPTIPVTQESVPALPTILLNSNSIFAKPAVGGEVSPPSPGVPGEASEGNETHQAVVEGFTAEEERIEVRQELENNSVVPQVNDSVAPPVKDEDSVGDVSDKKSDLIAEVKSASNIVDNNALNGDEEVRTRGAESVGPSGTSSKTFEQLSSATNAFAGSFGTGFSSTPSVVNNSSLSHVSSGFAFGQPFTFGSQRFGSLTTFGVGQSNSSFGASQGGSQGIFPSVSSVFGKSNGSGSPPLFGSLAPPAAAPKPAVVSLPEIHVETGEEKEKAIFTADAALFEFLDGGWKERGKGELRLNVSEEKDKRPRLVMRSKGNYRLLLNASLFPDMKLSKMDNRGISFVCANSAAEGKTGLTTYAVKLKDAVVASEFTATVQAHKGNTSSEPRTPESSPKATERPSKVVETSDIEA